MEANYAVGNQLKLNPNTFWSHWLMPQTLLNPNQKKKELPKMKLKIFLKTEMRKIKRERRKETCRWGKAEEPF